MSRRISILLLCSDLYSRAGQPYIEIMPQKSGSENKQCSTAMSQFLSDLTLKQYAEHRILALALNRGFLPRQWACQGERRLLENLRRQAVIQGLLKDLGLRIEKANGLQVGLLKGCALWGDIYTAGERETSDIDLFVEAGDHSRLALELEKLSFMPLKQGGQQPKTQSHKTLYVSPNFFDLTIEVHCRLWRAEPSGFRWQWRNAVHGPYLRLSVEDQLIHLCGHWIAQHTMISLHWLFDIIFWINSNNHVIDWRLVDRRGTILRLKRSVDLARGIYDRLEDGNTAKNLGVPGLDFDFLIEPKKTLWRYWLVKHLVQESWSDALKYDFQWLVNRLGSNP